jgi:hypothetical protein
VSKAGLFYTGKADKTAGFYCGGGLKDWKEYDIQMTEHVSYFRNCPYVQSLTK